MTEKDQPTPADGEKKARASGEKKARASRKLFLYVGGDIFTALLGWSINYYLPGLLSDSSTPPPIAVDVIDNPSLIDTFAAAPETSCYPAAYGNVTLIIRRPYSVISSIPGRLGWAGSTLGRRSLGW